MGPTLTGDVAINHTKRQFGLADAAWLAGVPTGSLRNWQARGILQIGVKSRTDGRFYFNIKDVFRLTVMHDLCVRPGMSFNPTNAVRVADIAMQKAFETLVQPRDGYRQDLTVVIAWDEDGIMFATVANVRHPGHYHPAPAQNEAEELYSPLRRTIVCIPAAALLRDIIVKVEHLQRRNARAEAPTHV